MCIVHCVKSPCPVRQPPRAVHMGRPRLSPWSLPVPPRAWAARCSMHNFLHRPVHFLYRVYYRPVHGQSVALCIFCTAPCKAWAARVHFLYCPVRASIGFPPPCCSALVCQPHLRVHYSIIPFPRSPFCSRVQISALSCPPRTCVHYRSSRSCVHNSGLFRSMVALHLLHD